MAPRRLSGGWHRRRPTARPLTVGAAARRPCDFRWTAPPPLSSPAIPNGRRLTAQQPPRFPADGASPPNSPAPPLADVVDTTRRPFDPPADADIIVAGCTRGASIRATGALHLAAAPPNSALPAARQTARLVLLGVWSWQYISAMYSNKANHGKN